MAGSLEEAMEQPGQPGPEVQGQEAHQVRVQAVQGQEALNLQLVLASLLYLLMHFENYLRS
ncbi:MAG: hypothetical protein CMN94_05060 [Synechococcus sp. EAC657]|nr:hypothetical protein [Synechococcus sp. EAC657]